MSVKMRNKISQTLRDFFYNLGKDICGTATLIGTAVAYPSQTDVPRLSFNDYLSAAEKAGRFSTQGRIFTAAGLEASVRSLATLAWPMLFQPKEKLYADVKQTTENVIRFYKLSRNIPSLEPFAEILLRDIYDFAGRAFKDAHKDKAATIEKMIETAMPEVVLMLPKPRHTPTLQRSRRALLNTRKLLGCFDEDGMYCYDLNGLALKMSDKYKGLSKPKV